MTVSNPGSPGVFLSPNATTCNVPAFPPFPSRPGPSKIVGHVFPLPFSFRPVLAGFRPLPVRLTLARKPPIQKTGVDVVGRPSFRPLPGRPETSDNPGRPFPLPRRSMAVRPVQTPLMRSTPTVGRQTPTVDVVRRPIPTPDDPGRPRPDGRRRPDGRSRRSTTVDDPGRRPKARNGNGGLRI